MKTPLSEFKLATCTPLNILETSEPLTQAFSMLVFMSNAFELSGEIDAGRIRGKNGEPVENYLHTMNHHLVAKALDGIATLVALGAAAADEEVQL